MTMTTVQIQTEVYCTLQVEGTHCWQFCPLEEVEYLRDIHRHIFHIKAHKTVTHTDRDVEFIMLKHQIHQYLMDNYYTDELRLCEFGSMSCEMIALELITEFDLCQCDVSEDGENGAVVRSKLITEMG